MGFDAEWTRAASTLFAVMGLPAVVTRPAPHDTPVQTRAIWMSPKAARDRSGAWQPPDPYGTDRLNRDPRQYLALPRSADLPSAPPGTRIQAADVQDGAVKEWRVEGYAGPMTRDEMRVIVLEMV